MAELIERYQAGAYEEVWAELLKMGDGVRSEPIYSDALAVAYETMRRARFNINLLIPRLRAYGYQFGYAWVTEQQGYDTDLVASVAAREARQPSVPWGPPQPEVYERVIELERLIGGSIPISLRAWYEVVGQVNFVGELPKRWGPTPGTIGYYQSLGLFSAQDPSPALPPNSKRISETPLSSSAPLEKPGEFGWVEDIPEEEEQGWVAARRARLKQFGMLDPLYVLPIDEALSEVQQQIAHRQYHPRLFVPIAPDFAYKYWRAGGGRTRIDVPNAAIDGELDTDWLKIPFVEYLRLCFRWAGLPELAYFVTARGKEELRQLTEGLLPL